MSDIANPPDTTHKPSTPESEALGKIIRAGRRAASLTMGDLARALGCTVSRVSDIELGEEPLSTEEMEKIAFAIWPWKGA